MKFSPQCKVPFLALFRTIGRTTQSHANPHFERSQSLLCALIRRAVFAVGRRRFNFSPAGFQTLVFLPQFLKLTLKLGNTSTRLSQGRLWENLWMVSFKSLYIPREKQGRP